MESAGVVGRVGQGENDEVGEGGQQSGSWGTTSSE